MSFHEVARRLVQRGWFIFPCKPEDKKPYTARGFHDSSNSDPQIDDWAAQYPNALCAIDCGRSGLVVVDIDIDPTKDKNGLPPWLELCKPHGEPETYTVKTRRGGFHLYFKGVGRSTADHLARGIDTRGVGGYVIAWPDVLDAREPAPAPAWLLTELTPRARARAEVDLSGVERRPLTHSELMAFVHKTSPDVGKDALAVAYGKAWGSKGGRDAALSKLCWALCSAHPWLDPDGTALLFTASCAAVQAEDEASTTVTWVAEKLARKLAPAAQENAGKAEAIAEKLALVAAFTAQRTLHASRPAPLEAAPDESPAEAKARELAQTPVAAKNDWILGTPQGFFLLAESGYEGPFTKELTPARARDTLAYAHDHVILGEWSGDKFAPKPATTLVHDYGRVPLAMHFTLTGETRLDADVLYYRALAVAALEPEYDPEIARWLALLAGDQLEPFLDWLATFLQLDRPTCAVMIKAAPGVGKGLLIDGLAQLFGGVSVAFIEAVSTFNGKLSRCPLVVADESLSAGLGINAVDELKKLVGDSTRSIADKNVKATTLHGCLRMLVTTNHHGSFKFGRELTEADAAALDQRILLLKPDATTAGYLIDIGGREKTEAWVRGQGLARHVLWLAQTRTVASGSRFLVEGRGGVMNLLTTEGKGTAPLLRAVVNALVRPNSSGAVVIHEGAFWVAKKRVTDEWDTLNKQDELPVDLESAWLQLCVRDSSRKFREGNVIVRRCQLKSGPVFSTARRMDLAEDVTGLIESVPPVPPCTTQGGTEIPPKTSGI